MAFSRVFFPTVTLSALLIAPLSSRAQPGLSEAELSRWAAELGSRQFAVRQNATRRLIAAGPAAASHLATAIETGDAEVRSRGLRVLVEQSLTPRADLRQPAKEALERLAASVNPSVAQSARGALDKLRDVTARLAAAELTRLGASVMPRPNTNPPTYAVQIGEVWTGGDAGLALLADLGNVIWLSIENAPLSDDCLPHIARLTKLQNLYLGTTPLSGNGLAQLAPLESLQYLSVKQLPIDDRKLAELPDFPQLGQLGLDRTLITDAGLAEMARYQALHTLWLDYTPVTDAGLVHLQPLVSLRALYLAGTQSAGPGLASLKQLPALRSLSLKGARLGPDSLRQLGQIEQLESLGLDNTNVTDSQLADLRSLARLRVLWLNRTPVTDAGLKELTALTRLSAVYLTGTKVSSDAISELKQAMPQLQIEASVR